MKINLILKDCDYREYFEYVGEKLCFIVCHIIYYDIILFNQIQIGLNYLINLNIFECYDQYRFKTNRFKQDVYDYY
jgi:hypothetical protein